MFNKEKNVNRENKSMATTDQTKHEKDKNNDMDEKIWKEIDIKLDLL